MKHLGKKAAALLISAMLLLSASGLAMAAEKGIVSDAKTVERLGLLVGDGKSVSQEYLAKGTTRMQAAIISLRLQGKLDEALKYAGKIGFADSDKAGKHDRPVLAYLKDHPELGWKGMADGKFAPLAPVSAQQFYKVLLEAAGYKTDKDFKYAKIDTFAASKGLNQIAGVDKLTNAHIATALIEALGIPAKQGGTLLAKLQQHGQLPKGEQLLKEQRIKLQQDAKLGTYFTDVSGRSLYYFTKDAKDLEACQGECIQHWPLFASEQLHIPATMNADDFSVLTRPDGVKQWTYKGWPLYYFAGDQAAGDTNGQGLGGVWYVVQPQTADRTAASAQK